MKTVEITVSPSGETHVETKGFTGRECQHASRFLAKALGKKTGEQLKPEFYGRANIERTVESEL